ncbi:inositol polyphosphate-5-phosphatase A isoform X2 [Anthonomus grandis grandis]|uniref:inositol polyphosphate-5-phosphatase A isoform X2 n=1 Tax=Anthonomus grandis grandis TaxID=2921223 RepID=UPI002165E578|nr:inositol polyphosphate-5-phosphatase A isoform X2 [Anthonomus grandis grandis]
MGSVPVLLVTANVGSIFEEPTEMLKLWTDEFLSKIASLDAKFIALHCQEVGGKKYEKSMKHVERFVQILSIREEMKNFSHTRIFLDEDYTSVENFTALGNLYFIHNSIQDAFIWDFKKSEFRPVVGTETFSGNIEFVDTKEKSKFPQHFFPECKWSRKGFMRTRWSLCGTVFDLVNIHLFHDASNLVSMSSYPSVYCRNRQRALEHTLYRFHNDPLDNVPYFVFGDFNFRTDNEGVIRTLTNGLTKTRVQNTKNNDQTKLHFNNEENDLILSVGKKEFSHNDHEKVFLDFDWLKKFDKEPEAFSNILAEYPIGFAPSYPFEEKISKGSCYMPTRCPAWCDRILFSHSAEKIIEESDGYDYGLLGMNTCMGDHKPVFLRISLRSHAGTVKCCDHELFVCLSDRCRCCRNFASVTINVVDMSEYINRSVNDVTIDSTLLHDRASKGMFAHDPYTPESSNSRTPLQEEDEDEDQQDEEDSRRSSVSPTELKSKIIDEVLEKAIKVDDEQENGSDYVYIRNIVHPMKVMKESSV